MAEIGAVDLAITQFSNSFSMMDAANRTGFNQMDQVKPRLIIPTHTTGDAEIAAGPWPAPLRETPALSRLGPALYIPEKTTHTMGWGRVHRRAVCILYKLAEWK
jgi:hypothetical protein